jgi:hypothetical protein
LEAFKSVECIYYHKLPPASQIRASAPGGRQGVDPLSCDLGVFLQLRVGISAISAYLTGKNAIFPI